MLPVNPSPRSSQTIATVFNVTPRETQILDLLCLGYEDKEITATLGISLGTLRTYMSRLFRKSRQRRRSGLVAVYMTFHVAAALQEQPGAV